MPSAEKPGFRFPSARGMLSLKGRENWMIPILMALFALGGTTYGMAEETLAFYVLLIPVMIAAKYDALTAVAVILLGAGVGFWARRSMPSRRSSPGRGGGELCRRAAVAAGDPGGVLGRHGGLRDAIRRPRPGRPHQVAGS